MQKYAKGIIASGALAIMVAQQYGVDLCNADTSLMGLPIAQYVAPIVAIIGGWLVVKVPNKA